MPRSSKASTQGLGATVQGPVRKLVLVFGDQLDPRLLDAGDLDSDRDALLLVEVEDEATHVPSHKQRTALFLSAMRHYALERGHEGWRVRYVRLNDRENVHSFGGEVERAVRIVRPEVLHVFEPGEHRIRSMVEEWSAFCPVELAPDTRFLASTEIFEAWARGRSAPLIMEYFYRAQRRRLDILVDGDGKPEGGRWNFDAENREPFGKEGPRTRLPLHFEPDEVTREVIDLVNQRFPEAPGTLEAFGWPTIAEDAETALHDFVRHRLEPFGPFQDAMWTNEPFLNHSLLSPALNLGLLDPRTCVEAAVAVYEKGKAPLQSVEAFVRQIIGWREYIRGVYDLEGPDYAGRNGLDQHGQLPEFYWTAETEMSCLRQCIGQVLEHGYGHHIQRLMVTGNFALISGVHPRAVSDWYLGMYVDAVDWVTLPNTLGMVMHADGRDGETQGVVGTKPYAASGRYIHRMSNYCQGCRYDPGKREGENACPFTVFYWEFLLRNETSLRRNARMGLIVRNVDRISSGERSSLRRTAGRIRDDLGIGVCRPTKNA